MEKLHKLEVVEREGMSISPVLAIIFLVIVSGALLTLGFIIVARLQNSADTSDLTANQTAQLNQINGSTNDNFDLTTLLVYAAVAMGVLSTFIGILAYLR